MTSALMISEPDEELLGTANRSDAMGVLAVWSARARHLVPHLTEQTTSVRGFQILVEALRLWELYEPAHPAHAGRAADFFILVEQAFARTVAGRSDEEWPLPGARRVNARRGDDPHVSVVDRDWHLLGTQKDNGVWGLYRGAAGRAGLLDESLTRLSAETHREAAGHRGLGDAAQRALFVIVGEAMEGATVPLPTRLNNPLVAGLRHTFQAVPLAAHLEARLIIGHDLNRALAARLVASERLDHRALLAAAARELAPHRSSIEDAVRCEDLLAVVESVFLWLCASRGHSVAAAVAGLPVDLGALRAAHQAFGRSGAYSGATARGRHLQLLQRLDPSGGEALARSVLALHQTISEERQRAAWVWEEHGLLRSDVEVARPSDLALRVGVAWRNDYYLRPLRGIAQQLEELRA